jgi:hypothetical protein
VSEVVVVGGLVLVAALARKDTDDFKTGFGWSAATPLADQEGRPDRLNSKTSYTCN